MQVDSRRIGRTPAMCGYNFSSSSKSLRLKTDDESSRTRSKGTVVHAVVIDGQGAFVAVDMSVEDEVYSKPPKRKRARHWSILYSVNDQ